MLCDEAALSVTRACVARSDSDEYAEAGAAAAAILCSAAACEARVSEYLVHEEIIGGDLSPPLAAIRDERDATTQWKELLAIVTPTYSCGSSQPFLAIGCLFRIRDHVAHRHARILVPGDMPLKLADCVRQRIIPIRKDADSDWVSAVVVHEVAQWAHTTAQNWLALVYELAPLRC